MQAGKPSHFRPPIAGVTPNHGAAAVENPHENPVVRTAAVAADSSGAGSILADYLSRHREKLLTVWLDLVGTSATLQPRPDGPEDVRREELCDYFHAILQQAADPEDFSPLEAYIGSQGTDAFRPDVACRLTLALKYSLQQLLAEAYPDGPEHDSLHLCAGRWLDEVLVRVADLCHQNRYRDLQRQEGERSRALRATQERLQTLLETMNEGFTAVDTTEAIIRFNQRMEEITGFERAEVIGRHVFTIYTAQSQEILKDQLEKRRSGESSSYELHVAHKDGHEVPVRVSGAPLHDDESHYVGSFAVVTDISKRVEAENALRQSNSEIARLLEVEQKRSAHLATITDVARIALATLEPNEIFRRVVHAVQEQFSYYHTSLFLIEEGTDQMVLHARAGMYEVYLDEGYRQGIGEGIVGSVVATGEAALANDVAQDPRRILACPEEASTGAELCVPIRMSGRVIGALDVQSMEPGVFDDSDLGALQILADQIAWIIHNARLFQETLHLKEFNEQILQTIPLPVLLMDEDLVVAFANHDYCERHGVSADELLGRPILETVPASLAGTEQVRQDIEEVFETGKPLLIERVQGRLEYRRDRIVNLLLSRVEGVGGTPLVVYAIEDITESIEKAYQSSLLRQIGQTMQGILDLDRLLYAVLTGVTAGTALGFNRAILFRVDRTRGMIEGRMGVGPSSHEEAGQIWGELAQRDLTVEEILDDYDRQENPAESPLSRAARQVRIRLDEEEDVLANVVRERRTLIVSEEDSLVVSPALWSALGTHHFVAVPLTAKGEALGVIVADNLYSGTPIKQDSVDLLTAFAGHAALAIENAELYHQLEDKILQLEQAQEELVLAERLAVIGEMSARMAHEIRNPMTTIGGFARSILKKPEPDRVKTAATVILEETERLEKLLADTLSFTRPSLPEFTHTDLYLLIREVHVLVADDLESKGIAYEEYIDPGMPTLNVDAAQIKQVLINILQNAVQAMPEGGRLYLSASPAKPPEAVGDEAAAEPVPLPAPETEWVLLEVADTGEGIPQEAQEQVFNPFFSTKTYGTGLGLAICKKIVDDHAGILVIQGAPDQGTTVRIYLPSKISYQEGLYDENPVDC